MTIEMLVTFTVMSLALSVVLGAFYGSVRRTVMFLNIFLGLSWGIGIGTFLTDNDLVWFLVFAPVTMALLFQIVKLVDPNYFTELNKESRNSEEVPMPTKETPVRHTQSTEASPAISTVAPSSAIADRITRRSRATSVAMKSAFWVGAFFMFAGISGGFKAAENALGGLFIGTLAGAMMAIPMAGIVFILVWTVIKLGSGVTKARAK